MHVRISVHLNWHYSICMSTNRSPIYLMRIPFDPFDIIIIEIKNDLRVCLSRVSNCSGSIFFVFVSPCALYKLTVSFTTTEIANDQLFNLLLLYIKIILHILRTFSTGRFFLRYRSRFFVVLFFSLQRHFLYSMLRCFYCF